MVFGFSFSPMRELNHVIFMYLKVGLELKSGSNRIFKKTIIMGSMNKTKIRKIVLDNRDLIIDKWNEYFGKR